MAQRLHDLRVRKVSLVDRAAVRDTDQPGEPMRFLVWKSEAQPAGDCGCVTKEEEALAAALRLTKAEGTIGGTPISELPDSSFAWIKPGGTKDDQGRTDSDHRAYPIKDKGGKLDRAHVANARSRCAQDATACPAPVQRTLAAAARALSMGDDTMKEDTDVTKQAEVTAALREAVTRAGLSGTDADAVGGALATLAAHRQTMNGGWAELAKAAGLDQAAPTIRKEELAPEVRALIEKAEADAAAATAEANKAHEVAKTERDARLRRESIAKAETMTHVPELGGKPVEFGELLLKCEGALDADTFGTLERVLKATHEQLRDSELFKSQGREGAGYAAGGALGKVEAKVAELRKADPKLTEAQAWDQVLKSDPELYREYREGN